MAVSTTEYYTIKEACYNDFMPIFEYKCNVCEEDFEKLVFGNQAVRCPKCASDNIKKKMSAFGMSGVEKPFAGSSSGCASCTKGTCSSCK